MTGNRPRVGIRCDVGPSIGVGHFMRCASLAEEMLTRGWQVEFYADVASVPLAQARLAELGCEWYPALQTPEEHVAWVNSRALDAVVIDSYLLEPGVSRELAEARPTLAVIDGSPRGQAASIYLDQNYGAERVPWPPADVPKPAAQRLAGTDYALLSDQFRRLRPATQQGTGRADAALRVVVALGGTDAMGLSEVVVDAILDCQAALDVTVVSRALANRPDEHMEPPCPQHVRFVAPSLEFPQWLADADLVVSASGTSLWELCCLGKPVAALAVADNQVQTYTQLVADGVVFGLGDVSAARPSAQSLARGLAEVMTDPPLRGHLAARAFSLVDGDGKVRVVDALAGALAADSTG